MVGVVLIVVGTGMFGMTIQMCEHMGEVVGVDGLTIEETCQVEVEEEVAALVLRGFEHGVVEVEAGAGVAAEAEVTAGVTAEAGATAIAQGVVVAVAAATAVVVIDIKGGLAKVSLIRWLQIQECRVFRLLLHP